MYCFDPHDQGLCVAIYVDSKSNTINKVECGVQVNDIAEPNFPAYVANRAAAES